MDLNDENDDILDFEEESEAASGAFGEFGGIEDEDQNDEDFTKETGISFGDSSGSALAEPEHDPALEKSIDDAAKTMVEALGVDPAELEKIREQIKKTTAKVKSVEADYDKVVGDDTFVKTALENELDRQDELAEQSISAFMANAVQLYIDTTCNQMSMDKLIDERTFYLSISKFVQTMDRRGDDGLPLTSDQRAASAIEFFKKNFDIHLFTDGEEVFSARKLSKAFREHGDGFAGYLNLLDDVYDKLYGMRPFTKSLGELGSVPIKLDTYYRL